MINNRTHFNYSKWAFLFVVLPLLSDFSTGVIKQKETPDVGQQERMKKPAPSAFLWAITLFCVNVGNFYCVEDVNRIGQ